MTGKWYLVRHGETNWNDQGRIQGHTDVPLNDGGRQQISLLAERLAGHSFSAVYASDLSRATESARVLIGCRRLAIHTDADLREFDYGRWEGLTVRQAEEENPRVFEELIRSGDEGFAAPGGENTGQLLERVGRFCERMSRRHDADEDLLIVAHAGSIRALMLCLLELDKADFWRFGVDPTSLSAISNHPGGRVLELWNDTSHLAFAGRAGGE